MSKIVQEKFQMEYAQTPEGVNTGRWKFAKSARVSKGMPLTKEKNGNPAVRRESQTFFLNSLPPGMDIEDQELADIRNQPEVMAGESDVSYDCPGSGEMKRGFFRKKMSPTDDLYTNEHVDLFYGEVKVEVEEGEMETGFLERGNLLDRL